MIKNVLTPLTKSVLIIFGLTTAVRAADADGNIRNNNTNYNKHWHEKHYSYNSISKKEQKNIILSMLLGTLAAIL